ncbi:MAG: hypothetical protein LBQ93_05355 [Treponema sp.]|nr:hypothetical protein [Treponema sp.]
MNTKRLLILYFFIILCSCQNNEYKQLINGHIVSPEKQEYIFLAHEGKYFIFGESSFISYIKWQPRKLHHLGGNTDTGVYSFNNDPNLTILRRVKFNSEWSEIYIKKELTEIDYSFKNCILFKFADTKSPLIIGSRSRLEYLEGTIGIYKADDIKYFLEYIKNNEINTNEIYNYRRNPFDIMAGNDGFVGYIFGFFQYIPYLAFPGTVWQKDDETYCLIMDRKMYEINIDWLKKLGYIND